MHLFAAQAPAASDIREPSVAGTISIKARSLTYKKYVSPTLKFGRECTGSGVQHARRESHNAASPRGRGCYTVQASVSVRWGAMCSCPITTTRKAAQPASAGMHRKVSMQPAHHLQHQSLGHDTREFFSAVCVCHPSPVARHLAMTPSGRPTEINFSGFRETGRHHLAVGPGAIWGGHRWEI